MNMLRHPLVIIDHKPAVLTNRTLRGGRLVPEPIDVQDIRMSFAGLVSVRKV